MNTTVDQPSPTVAVIGLEGELDASNFADLIGTGRQLYAGGARVLVLDLGGLTFMASSGIVALHSLARVFQGHEPPDLEAGWQAIHDIGTDIDGGASLDHVRLVAPGSGRRPCPRPHRAQAPDAGVRDPGRRARGRWRRLSAASDAERERTRGR